MVSSFYRIVCPVINPFGLGKAQQWASFRNTLFLYLLDWGRKWKCILDLRNYLEGWISSPIFMVLNSIFSNVNYLINWINSMIFRKIRIRKLIITHPNTCGNHRLSINWNLYTCKTMAPSTTDQMHQIWNKSAQVNWSGC